VLTGRVVTRLLQGDVAGARRITHDPGIEIPPAQIAIILAKYNDLFWVLDTAQQTLLFRARPADFDGDIGGWALALAETYALRGDDSRARSFADTARAAFASRVRATPDDTEGHALLGVALAYMGHMADAIREGERAVALAPLARDLQGGAYAQLQLVRINLLAGDRGRALDLLEPLLAAGAVTPAWLRIDPAFNPLRGNPRFERLASERQAAP
jgi:tetratricopeptide (TPR) repeat protein